jgi:hypothetical protein
MEARVECQRLARRLKRGIEAHVAVVVHRPIARRDNGKSDDARFVGELLDHLDARVGVVERQVHHRLDARLARQEFLDQPPVEGPPQCHLHLGLRMHAQQQHRRRERHRVVDAHAVHRPSGQLDLTMRALTGHRLRLLLLVRDAAEHVLERHAGLRVQQAWWRAAALAERLRRLPKVVIVDAVGDVGPECGLGDVRIDIDDEVVRQLAGALRGMREHIARIRPYGDLFQFAYRRGGRGAVAA